MAAVLDLGSLTYFTPVLIFVLVFVILYALLEKARVLGENSGLHGLVAFIFSLLFVLIKPFRQLLLTIIPWFVILFLLVVIILIGIMILGFKKKDITEYISDNPGITITLVIIIVTIFFVGLSSTFPGAVGFPSEDVDDGRLFRLRSVLFDHRVLGIFLVLIIAYFVVRAAGFVAKKED